MKKIYILLLLCIGMVNAQPIIVNPAIYLLCDNGNDNVEIFDLTTKNAEILATNNPSLYSIAYFTSQIDANNNTNLITNPTAFQTSTVTVYARVWENANPNNYATTSFYVEVININLATPNDLLIFETPFDGIAAFDLTIRNTQITNGNPESYNFSFFTSLADAQNNSNAIVNPTSYTNSANNQTIYIRVTTTDSSACSSITNFKVSVLDQNLRPIIQSVSTSRLCEVNNGGYGILDLSTENSIFLASNNPMNYTVGYYSFIDDAELGNSNSELLSHGYTTFTASTLYVRVTENANSNNYSIGTLNIYIDPIPVANTISNLFIYESPFDGIATFNLPNVNATLIGAQTGFVSKFYTTQADANNNVNEISNSTSYLNNVNQQIIWVRVFNPTNLNCFQT